MLKDLFNYHRTQKEYIILFMFICLSKIFMLNSYNTVIEYKNKISNKISNDTSSNKLLKNILLSLILITYFYGIYNITLYCNKDEPSISEVLNKQEVQLNIILITIVFSLFNIFYESLRKNKISFITNLVIILGIFGLLFVHNKIQPYHDIFAFITFIFMFMFMSVTVKNWTCYYIVCIQVFISIMLFLTRKHDEFFGYELLFLIIFAVYYLYLHYLDL